MSGGVLPAYSTTCSTSGVAGVATVARMLVAFFGAVALVWLPAPGAEPSSIGYPTVGAALDALRNDPRAHFEVRGGWTLVTKTENGSPVLWSFTPEGHPAHPSTVKRSAVQKDGAWYIEMDVLCGSTQAACDLIDIVHLRISVPGTLPVPSSRRKNVLV
jgi:hypothetical protein